MRVFLFSFVFASSLQGMNFTEKKALRLSNVSQIECIKDFIIFTRTFSKPNKVEIFIHNVNTNKTSLVYEVKHNEPLLPFVHLSPVDRMKPSFVFRVTDNMNSYLMDYDLTKETLFYIQQKSPLGSGDVWWDEEQKNFLLFSTNGYREVFRENITSHWKDERLTKFFMDTNGTIYDYDPKSDTVLSYCNDEKGYYYGKIDDFSLDAHFLKYTALGSYCYLGQTIVKTPLMIRFCKCKDRKAVCRTDVLVFDMLKNTCVSIENGDSMIAADIYDNILVTLSYTAKLRSFNSYTAKLRFFNIKEQKCVWGPCCLDKKAIEFSDQQKELSSKLVSLDGRFCVIALSNGVVRMPVPFIALYGIKQKKLTSIILALKKSIRLPKDILWLVVSKIITLPTA